ncbi:MAG: hypothetical protein JZU64_08965 [Rhodoferax sp.]|jgi:hypothetical protein|nr:hypothetical protein [Rhodoferax sp.]
MPAIASNYRRTLALLWLAAAVLLGLTWWHVFALESDSRAKELATAERDLDMGNQLDLTALTEKGVIDADIFPQVGIIDAQGIYVLANLPVTGKLDLSDRENFKVHLAANTGQLFVSKPVLGRASGKWSIQLTQRINRADAAFAGVVVVSVDPGYFTRFYSELQLGSQGVVALYGMDGIQGAQGRRKRRIWLQRQQFAHV